MSQLINLRSISSVALLENDGTNILNLINTEYEVRYGKEKGQEREREREREREKERERGRETQRERLRERGRGREERGGGGEMHVLYMYIRSEEGSLGREGNTCTYSVGIVRRFFFPCTCIFSVSFKRLP